MAEGTKNQVTLTALIEAAGRFREGCSLTIHTGDRFVANMITHNLDTWVKNDFRRANGNPLANRDLWILLDRLLKPHQITAQAGEHRYSAELKEKMEENDV